MTIRPALLALPLVTALLLASCSDDSGDGDDAATVDALAEELSGDEARISADADEARCVAEDVVDDLGADRVEEIELRLVQPALTDDEADAVYEAFAGCIELVDQLTDSLADGMTAAKARCGAEAYVESGLLRDGLLAEERSRQLNARIDETIATAAAAC